MNSTTIMETGCYLDSHCGHYIIRDAVYFAVDHGFIIDGFESFALSHYESHSRDDTYPFEELVELSDRAIRWLNSSPWKREIRGQNCPPRRPEDAYWGWNDGDFGLYTEDDPWS